MNDSAIDGAFGGALLRLSGEASRMASAIQEIAAVASAASRSSGEITAATVRAIIRARRHRSRFFEEALFADPAWDMLLDLKVAWLEDRSVPVSSLCIAAAVPHTTALRWISAMADKRLLLRHPDPNDARRVLVELHDDTAAAMANYLCSVRALTHLVT